MLMNLISNTPNIIASVSANTYTSRRMYATFFFEFGDYSNLESAVAHEHKFYNFFQL